VSEQQLLTLYKPTELDSLHGRAPTPSKGGLGFTTRGTLLEESLSDGMSMSPQAGSKLSDNPTYAKNARRLNDEAAKDGTLNPAVVGPGPRIVGGLDEDENLFPDCVCVGSTGGYCCTGTLIRKNAVLTAGHCFPCVRVNTKVFIGQDISRPQDGTVCTAKEVIRHRDYGQGGKHNDLCLIILDKDVEKVTPREIATAQEIAAASWVRAVGYGTTDFTGSVGFGRRRYVDLPIASHLCGGEMEATDYGCDKDLEMVAGMVGLNKDTCRGDSGGPVYVKVKDKWKLAGATSRATLSAPRVCGDGGIYVRVDQYTDWIETTSSHKK